MSSCGADTEANSLLTTLLVGEDVTLPVVDFSTDLFLIPDDIAVALKKPVDKLTVEQITTGEIGGSGVFDKIMAGMKAQLKEEFDKNRITGAEYTKVYIALMEGALQNSVQFLVQRDASYWAAISAQIAALTARMALEAAKMQLAESKFRALTAKGQFALVKLQLATEDQNYCVTKFNLETILPLNATQLTTQNAGLLITNNTASFNLDNLLPLQQTKMEKEIDGTDIANLSAQYSLDNLLPAQLSMLLEQVEAQRAQTLDDRTDATPITGLLGKQKALYSQQIVSYMRDAEVKAAKLFTDAWITMKTIDEGLLPPTNFDNASLDEILGVLKTNNAL